MNTDARRKASANYLKTVTQINFRVKPEKKTMIQDFASHHGVSVNALLLQAVDYFMDHPELITPTDATKRDES